MLIDSPKKKYKLQGEHDRGIRLTTSNSFLAALTWTTIDPPRSANFSRVRRKFTHFSCSRAKDHSDSRHRWKLASLMQPIVVRVEKMFSMDRLGALRASREEEVTEKCAKNSALVREKKEKKARAAQKCSARLLEYWKKVTKLNYTFSNSQSYVSFVNRQQHQQQYHIKRAFNIT